jgi:flavodoxin I
MPTIKLFYGTDSGLTEGVAKTIVREMPEVLGPFDIARASPADFAGAEAFIFCMPTYGDGEMQDDWNNFYHDLAECGLAGKPVALVGLGDQVGYGHEFVNGLKLLYDRVVELGGVIVCLWPVEGYDFSHSEAIVDGQFVGLALDESNYPDQTEDKLAQWIPLVREAFAAQILTV